MTEDTSPENLRKFLESDDPATVMMGLSMAKGTGVPEVLLLTILGLYMWDDDKSVRRAAKSIFKKCAPREIQTKVKENWKNTYLTRDWPASATPADFRSIKDFDILDDIINANKKAIDPLVDIYNAEKRQAILWALHQIVKKHNMDPEKFYEKIEGFCVCPRCDIWYNIYVWESPSDEGYCEVCIEQLEEKFGPESDYSINGM